MNFEHFVVYAFFVLSPTILRVTGADGANEIAVAHGQVNLYNPSLGVYHGHHCISMLIDFIKSAPTNDEWERAHISHCQRVARDTIIFFASAREYRCVLRESII